MADEEVLAALADATCAYDVVRGVWWCAIEAAIEAGVVGDDLVAALGMSELEIKRELRLMDENAQTLARLDAHRRHAHGR